MPPSYIEKVTANHFYVSKEPYVGVHRRDASNDAVGGRRSRTPQVYFARFQSSPELLSSQFRFYIAIRLLSEHVFTPAAAGDATIPILTISDPHECPRDEPRKTV